MAEPAELFSELLRPQQLGDLTLPHRHIQRLQRMIESGSIMNLLFYGEPGTGKTSAAQVLMRALGPEDSIEINGSSANGIDFVRTRIECYAVSLPIFGGHKICFIDEAEYVSKPAQGALRKIIERMSSNCRFIFATNEVSKLIPALRSRFMRICFDVAPADRGEVVERLRARYAKVLHEKGASFDDRRLAEIVGIYFPDMRDIANHLEFEFL